jgi:uncharacterized membrane protein
MAAVDRRAAALGTAVAGGHRMTLEATRVALSEAIDAVGMAISLAGVAIIALGMLAATYRLMRPATGRQDAYVRYRREVGQAILLGLEFLVAADIIETVAVAPTVENVVVLAGIVSIRTFLSLALQVELEGRWPWQPRREDARAR